MGNQAVKSYIFTLHSSSHIIHGSSKRIIKNQMYVYYYILSFISFAGEKREIESRIVFSSYGVVHTENGLITTDNLPKQLTLLHTVQMSDGCTSVCSYRNITYVGHVNGVDKIEENNQFRGGFIPAAGPVDSVAVYKDKMYILGSKTILGHGRLVNVCHRHPGEKSVIKEHPDIIDYLKFNKMAFVNDQLVIPDRQNRKLIVYSLDGEVEKCIDCPLLGEEHVSICAVGDHSVVVSDCGTFNVFKVNILSGEVKWTSIPVAYPGGVAYYDGRVLLTNASTTTRVSILDGKTGNTVSHHIIHILPIYC